MADKRYYVYALVDPRDGKIFYIGKGCGDRIKQHVREARQRRSSVINARKCERIRDILAAGLAVEERVLARFAIERDALMRERDLILQYRAQLTNITLCSRPVGR
jgi:hypothetical protein